MKITLEILEAKIDRADKSYRILKDELGMNSSGVMYLKGHRDALVALYNNYK